MDKGEQSFGPIDVALLLLVSLLFYIAIYHRRCAGEQRQGKANVGPLSNTPRLIPSIRWYRVRHVQRSGTTVRSESFYYPPRTLPVRQTMYRRRWRCVVKHIGL